MPLGMIRYGSTTQGGPGCAPVGASFAGSRRHPGGVGATSRCWAIDAPVRRHPAAAAAFYALDYNWDRLPKKDKRTQNARHLFEGPRQHFKGASDG